MVRSKASTDLRALRRVLAQLEYLEVRDRELAEQVSALRQVVDRGLRSAAPDGTAADAHRVAEWSVQLGVASATLALLRQRRSALQAALEQRARTLRRDLVAGRVVRR